MVAFLGVDPGGRETGIVLRRRDDLLGHDVVVRRDSLDVPDGAYVGHVAHAALSLLSRAGLSARDPGLVVVSEDVRYWPQSGGHFCPACRRKHNPASQRNMTGVLGAAVVHGSILARWSDAVVVPPGSRHGSLHDTAYPPEIRAKGKGKDRLRHCRAAWDASLHGETLFHRRERGVVQ